jgi:hypothetical protein
MPSQPNDPRETDTVRDLPRPGSPVMRDTVPEQVGVYYAPRPLAPTSDHRTIQIKPVLLAPGLDPRRAPTELRLSAPPPPPRSRAVWLLLPLAVLAVTLGAVAAMNVPTDLVVTPVPNTPAVSTSEAREQSNERVATPAADVRAPGASTAQPTEVELKSLPALPPAQQSALPRKKKRDPWLE